MKNSTDIIKGKKYFLSGNLPASIQSFTAALEKEPGSPEILMGRGAAFLKLGKFDKAVHDLSIVLESDRDCERAFFSEVLPISMMAISNELWQISTGPWGTTKHEAQQYLPAAFYFPAWGCIKKRRRISLTRTFEIILSLMNFLKNMQSPKYCSNRQWNSSTTILGNGTFY